MWRAQLCETEDVETLPCIVPFAKYYGLSMIEDAVLTTIDEVRRRQSLLWKTKGVSARPRCAAHLGHDEGAIAQRAQQRKRLLKRKADTDLDGEDWPVSANGGHGTLQQIELGALDVPVRKR